jgi:hypothetical protein
MYRYVTEGELNAARANNNRIPNTTAQGKLKEVYYTPERFDSASRSEDALQIGQKNPGGPGATPTHRVEVDATSATWSYAGNVEGSSEMSIEATTRDELSIINSTPLAP